MTAEVLRQQLPLLQFALFLIPARSPPRPRHAQIYQCETLITGVFDRCLRSHAVGT